MKIKSTFENTLKTLLVKRSFVDVWAVGLLLLYLFANVYFLAVITIAILCYELIAYKNKDLITLKDSLVTYLIPVAITVNVALKDQLSTEYFLSALFSAIAMLVLVTHIPIVKKLTHRRVIVLGLKNKPVRRLKVSNGKQKFGWYLLLLVAIFTNLFWPTIALVVLLLLIVLLFVSTATIAVQRRRTDDTDKNNMEWIREYKPRFVVVLTIGQPVQMVYMMWDKYLKMTGEPFIVMTQRKHHLYDLRDQTDVPIVYYDGPSEIQEILDIKTIKAVFYTSNSPENMNVMLPTYPLHVALFHGDSDKSPSYRAVTGAYDKIFVAGQAAIDRYEKHGVYIPEDKFMIVGRPQVEDINISAKDTIKSVLYAPTWQGSISNMDYSSLYKGVEIVKALLNHGVRVIFRPHPLSRKSIELNRAIEKIYDILATDLSRTGTQHLYGKKAEVEMNVNDCFNKSNMMISDVSSVVSDYLYSEKPMILISMNDSVNEFIQKFPTSEAGYIVEKDLEELEATIGSLISGADDMHEKRRQIKERNLGKVKEGQDYTKLFIDGVKEVIDMPNPRRME